MNTDIDDGLGRRAFLRGLLRTTGIAAVAACAPASEGSAPPVPEAPVPEPAGEPELPDGLDARHFHVHNRSPLALETRRSAMGAGLITPRARFFVRNNLPRPDAAILDDPDAWALEVAGVAGARAITLGELKTLGLEMEAVVIQCSGNGRKFYAHGPSGSQWATGAAGCAMWTGVRVSTLLAHLGGVVDGVRYLTATGGEVLPEGVDRDTVIVERSIPIEKGQADAMLVWEMNGEPIPLTHGGPLRLVVPGYFGCNQIKYIKRLAATVEQTTAKIQRSGYRLRPIGEKGSPDFPSMWRMPVKSWLHGPGADGQAVLAGPVTFFGVALSGERGVEQVEVSLDGGATWQTARFRGPDLGPNAWRAFTFTTELGVGAHTLVSRATDTAGDVQPEAREENERGYGHNGWADHVPHPGGRRQQRGGGPEPRRPSTGRRAGVCGGHERCGGDAVLWRSQPRADRRRRCLRGGGHRGVRAIQRLRLSGIMAARCEAPWGGRGCPRSSMKR